MLQTICPARWHGQVLVIGVVFLLGLIALSVPSMAQRSAVIGAVDATGYDDVPEKATIWIRQSSSVHPNTEIAERITTALEQRGYKISKRAGHYVLAFRLAHELDFDPDPDKTLRFEDNSLMFRKRYRGRTRAPVANQPRIILAKLEDADGNLVWSGRASLYQAPEESQVLVEVLVPALLDEIFTTAYAKAIVPQP